MTLLLRLSIFGISVGTQKGDQFGKSFAIQRVKLTVLSMASINSKGADGINLIPSQTSCVSNFKLNSKLNV